MSNKISIAIDAMGGDNSPDKTIEGVKLFCEKNEKNYFYINFAFSFRELRLLFPQT